MAIGRVREPRSPRPRRPAPQHVHQHEGRHQPAELRIREPQRRRFRSGTMRRDDVTVEVVEQVDRREHAQRHTARSGRARRGVATQELPDPVRWTRRGL